MRTLDVLALLDGAYRDSDRATGRLSAADGCLGFARDDVVKARDESAWPAAEAAIVRAADARNALDEVLRELRMMRDRIERADTAVNRAGG